MNLFRRLGDIFLKMAPRRKPAAKLPEQKTSQNTEIAKEPPIRDIEELVVKSEPVTSPYFAPNKTRNQKLKLETADVKMPISPLAGQPSAPISIKNVVPNKTVKKSSKKAKKIEIQESLGGSIYVPEIQEASIEVLKQESVATKVEPGSPEKLKKTKKDVSKKSPKSKSIKTQSTEELKKPAVSSSSFEATPSSPVKISKRKSKEASKSPETKLEKWEPNNWRQILENVKIMRANVPAPVDTMGCDKCSDENADEKTRRFHVLLALMLSSQTKDEVTHEAMRRLTNDGSCTPQTIANMEPQKLETLLYPVSFYKNKTKYLQNTSKILVDQYDSDIPNDVKGLIKLPGVGPKMAHICMNSAWNIVTGIGVDVHVHRIANRLGWVREETKQPEQTRKALESWLPSDHWKEVNHLLVGFGQTICTPVKPKCNECLNKAICPAAFFVKAKKVSDHVRF